MNDDAVHIRLRKTEPLKVGQKVFRSACDWELTQEDLGKAAHELGETERKRKECLQKFKEKLLKESKLECRQDDLYLLRFLRVRKYDVEKAYQNVKLFSELRKKHSEFFLLPQELKSALESGILKFLPYANEDGTIMFWLNINKWNPSERTVEEIMQIGTAVSDIVSMNPRCHVNGITCIWNFSGLSMRQVSDVLWNGRMWGILSISQNGYPWRIKKIIVLNTNRVVRLFYNLLRPLVQRKILERVFLLGSDLNELHQHVDPAILPKSLNGSLEDEACDTSQYVLDNLPYLRYERTLIFQ